MSIHYIVIFIHFILIVSGHTYRHVENDQVLQRQRDTNSAWVELEDGQRLELGTGGPYQVGDAHGIMVGDIWILAGQSNMRGFGFFDTPLHRQQQHQTSSHVFRSNETWGIIQWNEPIHQIATSPRIVHHQLHDPTVDDPQIVFSRGASLGPAFVERYEQTLGVPVGLVPCAHGGVAIQEWMKMDNNNTINTNKLDIASTTLYGAMMDKIRLVGGHITGVLWYQGESDANSVDLALLYKDQFTQWIEQLAVDLQEQDHWFFIFAQIGRSVKVKQDNGLDKSWNLVRKAQMDVYRSYSKLKMAIVSTMDCDMDDYIHLSANGLKNIGYRMADAAVRWTEQQQEPVGLYPAKLTMVHLSFNHHKNWRHLLRLDFHQQQRHQTPTWLHHDQPIIGFTIHDAKDHAVDIIHSVRINEDHQIDLYLTEEGYQQLVKDEGYTLWYGYGRNTPCNLITTDHVAPLAFGPLPIISTPLVD